MTSYLATIATASHQTYVKMCPRDLRIATAGDREKLSRRNSRKALWGGASTLVPPLVPSER